jgi:hypothetical protein
MTQKTFDAICFTILFVIAMSMLVFALKVNFNKEDVVLCATLTKQTIDYKDWQYNAKTNPGGFYITQFQYDYCKGIGYELRAPIIDKK